MTQHITDGSQVENDYAGFIIRKNNQDQVNLAVDGITCTACIGRIEKHLGRLEGVISARVNYATQRVCITWNSGQQSVGHFIERLSELGYTSYPFDPTTQISAHQERIKWLLKCLAVAGFASANIMLLSVSVWSGNVSDITPETRDFFHWISALIAIPSVAYAGQPFFQSAIKALKSRAVNMDVPISLGVLLTVIMSVIETWQHREHAYFDSSVMLLFFLLIGRTLDEIMRGRTRSYAENLTALKAESAQVMTSEGGVRTMPLSQVEPGQRVLVRVGQRVPCDGIIVSGMSTCDQSLITGESRPQEVSEGDRVYAGTLNLSGQLVVAVTAREEASFMAEVERLLQQAGEARLKYVDLADRAAKLYAPVIHALSAATVVGWLLAGKSTHDSIMIAVTVLIITCPCALGLAIPVVQMIANGVLFKRGVLLQKGNGLERLAEVTTIVFDKTGTLTTPQTRILATSRPVSVDEEQAAARMALSSHHPLAQALVAALKSKHQVKFEPWENVKEISGHGIETNVSGRRWRLGRLDFCGAATDREEFKAQHPQASWIAFEREGEEPIVFAMGQQLRPDAHQVIGLLRQRGYELHILSGDNQAAVEQVAQELGITQVVAGVTPQEKIARLESLKQQGKKVLMVGDGLNDAPALAAASVSMSPMSAVHVSQTVADCLFVGEKLQPVVSALDVARKARLLMEQNLWMAVIYNVIAVPIAVAGWVTPLVAALAMSGSSILVTLNSLRARTVSHEPDTATTDQQRG